MARDDRFVPDAALLPLMGNEALSHFGLNSGHLVEYAVYGTFSGDLGPFLLDIGKYVVPREAALSLAAMLNPPGPPPASAHYPVIETTVYVRPQDLEGQPVMHGVSPKTARALGYMSPGLPGAEQHNPLCSYRLGGRCDFDCGRDYRRPDTERTPHG